jgi:hypothetical protein
VVDWAIEDCFREDQQTREVPKNDKSHNLQNQQQKNQKVKVMKKQNIKSQTRVCI